MHHPTPSDPLPQPPAARPRPAHRASDYDTWFQDPLVVDVYDRRPPYPQAAIDHLLALAAGASGTRADSAAVLDLAWGVRPNERQIYDRQAHR